MDSRASKKNEPLRRAKCKFYEVVTGICGFLVKYASNAEFIKSRYHYSTCTKSCNDGGDFKKSLVDFFLHGYINTSIISQSILSQSMEFLICNRCFIKN